MKYITTDFGVPVKSDQASLTVGENGPILLQDTYLLEKLSHFVREQPIPRAMHAKGAGAYGYFQVTNDVTKYTCADFLSCVGKKTKLFARFSQAISQMGSNDTPRNIRGFAMKFYTDEGNFDLLSITVPAFFISDIMKFPDFVHSQQPITKNNLPDPNTRWDFFSLSPETIHATTMFFTDRATPVSYKNIDTFGPNTFLWYNRNGERFLIKYHILTAQGIKNFTNEQATKIAGENPDYLAQDLYESIERGECPKWKLCVQIMPESEAANYRFDPYDPTQVWFYKDYPLVEVGEIVINQNPVDYYTEVEQVCLAVNNFVPGIGASNDKLLQGRLFAYRDAQNYRIGVNHQQLPINRPKTQVFNYERDGLNNISANGGGGPDYNPNSFENIGKYEGCKMPHESLCAQTGRFKKYNIEDTFYQTGEFYRRVLSDQDREHLITNISQDLQNANIRIKYRQTALFYKADVDYGTRIANAIGLDILKVAQLSQMEQEQRINITKDW